MSSEIETLTAAIAALTRRHDLGEYTAARPEAERVLAELDRCGLGPTHDLRIRAVEVTVALRKMAGDTTGARQLAEAALVASGSVGPPSGRLLMALAQVEQFAGRWGQAIDLAQRAELAVRDGLTRGAEIAAMTARWHTQLGDLEEAERCLTRAEAHPDLPIPQAAAVLHARADLEAAAGREGASLDAFRRLLALAQREGLAYVEAAALGALGRSAWLAGDLSGAVVRYREQKAIYACLEHGAGVARALNNLGELHRELGQVPQARAAYAEALGFCGDEDPEVTAVLHINLGQLELEYADVSEAAAQFERVLETTRRPMMRALAHLGRVPGLLGEGDSRGADEQIEDAERSWGDVTALDDDLPFVARRVAELLIRDSKNETDRGRAARLLALAGTFYERFGLVDPAVEVTLRARALGRLGASVPLGPFVLERRLGEGSSGTVWLAHHAQRGIPVAIKVLAPDAGRHLDAELNAVARLDHPHVVYLLARGRVGTVAAALEPRLPADGAWIAMEYVPGGTAADVAGRLAWPAARNVLLAVLDALAHAHARGILHLDIKPANVLLASTKEGPVPKLADFGLARVRGAGSDRISGSPAYMAPEQFVAGAELTPEADLYGVGCLATALVQGAPPFGAESIEAIREAHLTRAPPPLRARIAVPPGLDTWLQRMLAKSVGARFPSAAAAARALLALPEAVASAPSPQADFALSASWSATTLVLGDDLPPTPTPAPERSHRPRPRTLAVPSSWRRGPVQQRPPAVIEAGLSLYRLRAPRFVGREVERDRLWTVLREVASAGRPRLVALFGREGCGARALTEWIGERSEELGVARRAIWSPAAVGAFDGGSPRVVVVDDALESVLDAPAFRGDHPTLYLVIHHDERTVPLDPQLTTLWVGPMPDAELSRALDGRLPLASDVRSALVAASEGLPGRAFTQLRVWVERGRLVLHDDAYTLRPGTRLPERAGTTDIAKASRISVP